MNYAVLALIIVNIIWGFAPPIFKLALQNIPPFTLAFIRFAGAALIFLPAALITWKRLTRKEFLLTCAAGLTGITLNITFFFLGLTRGPSINVSIIASAGPLVMFMLAVVFLHERPKKKVLLGMLISLLGVLMIIFTPTVVHEIYTWDSILLANSFFVLAVLGAVVSPIIAKPLLAKINVYQFTFITFLISTFTFAPLAYHELSVWSFDQLDWRGGLGIVFGVLFSSAIAYFLFFWATKRIAAQEIGLFAYIDPIASLMLAIPLLGEYPTSTYIIGAILVFIGIFAAEGHLHWHPLNRLKVKG